jgi:hypothetical protein
MGRITHLVLGLVVTMVLAGCTTARYYASLLPPQEKLHCFSSESMGRYLVVDIPPSLLDASLERVNGIFSGSRGIYPGLFEHASGEGGKQCERDPEWGAHISAFSQAISPSAPPGAQLKGKDEQGQSKGKTGAAKAKEADSGTTSTGTPTESRGKDTTTPIAPRVQLVISSYLYSLHPADRLDKVYSLITPIDPGVEFLEVHGVTPLSPISFGSVTDLAEISASLGTPTGAPAAISLSPKLSRSFDRQIARKYATQNVEIFPLRNVLLISEDGGPAAADIQGNSAVEVTLSIPTSLCTYVDVFEPKTSQGALSMIKEFDLQHTCYVERVKVLVAAVGIARMVISGEKMVEEGEQDAQLRAFKTATVTSLWSNPTVLYGVEIEGQTPITFERKSEGLTGQILFDNIAAAARFRQFLLAEFNKGRAGDLIQGELEWKEGKVSVRTALPVDPSKVSGALLRICRFGRPQPDLSAYGMPPRRDLCMPL